MHRQIISVKPSPTSRRKKRLVLLIPAVALALKLGDRHRNGLPLPKKSLAIGGLILLGLSVRQQPPPQYGSHHAGRVAMLAASW